MKNTEYIIGVVVYTGVDTKIMQNADEARGKQSNLELMTNKLIIVIVLFELLMCFVIMIGSLVWNAEYADKYDWFIPKRYGTASEGILSFFTVFILLNTMIPISLIISLEMVKFTQAYIIDQDNDMVLKSTGQRCKTYNSSINEELGQIEYVFSDKTGTLTCNSMEFKCCYIADTFFGDKKLLGRASVLSRASTYRN